MTTPIINFYKKLPKKYIENKNHNPHFNKHGIVLPAFICISGRTGSGKTNSIMNFLSMASDTFDKVIICCKNFKSDPLYVYMKDKNKDLVEVYEDAVPSLDTLDPSMQYFVIIDDLVGDKKHEKNILEMFKRGRKFGKGVSCAFLTQDYFATSSFIRKNMNYLFLFPSNTSVEMNNMYRNFPFMREHQDVINKAIESKEKSDGQSPLSFLNINCIKNTVKLNF
tara:strand:- start:97 stop:765 length:669 start_codon:yes stop_codon:yes gene_type:complete